MFRFGLAHVIGIKNDKKTSNNPFLEVVSSLVFHKYQGDELVV